MRVYCKETKNGFLVVDHTQGEPLKYMTINGDFVENRRAAYVFKDGYNADFCARQFKMQRKGNKRAFN